MAAHGTNPSRAIPPTVVAGPDPVRRLAFWAGLGSLFLRLTSLSDLLLAALHPLYFFSVPAVGGLVITNGIQRALRLRMTLYWTALCLWMAAATVFSTWRGESFAIFTGYVKTVYPVVLLVAGLTVTWRDCRAAMYTVAASAGVFTIAVRYFQRIDTGGRITLSSATISNSNDIAAVLMLLLPFLAWIVVSGPLILRFPAAAGMIFGVYEVVHTASRGALIGLVVASLFYLWKAPGKQKIIFALTVPILIAAIVAFVPQLALERITQFSAADDPTSDAAMSAGMRRVLLLKSIEYTLKRPVFGVGPGEFANYEGQHNIIAGVGRGMWHNAHNSFTQLSSECGIVALALVIAAIVYAFRSVSRVEREARQRPECHDMRMMAFCMMLALISFCTTITFLNFAYSFHLPMLTTLAAVMGRAAPEEFQVRRAAVEQAQAAALVTRPGGIQRARKAASQTLQ